MNGKKNKIYMKLKRAEQENRSAQLRLTDTVSVMQYRHLVKEDTDGREIWSDALQRALDEHEVVIIPANKRPYYIDKSIIIPSDRRIEAATDAVIQMTEDMKVLLLRNEHTSDGTHAPIDGKDRDCNISITGGIWRESQTCRAGYGKSGMYDEERSFYGVSTCMLFNNIRGLTLKKMRFSHTAGFSVQIGDAVNVIAQDISFEECYADGLHINGNTENVIIRNISGQVGDDLVALNMYDWQNSSVNFGPLKTALCENLNLSHDSRYKAMRIEPGIYYYEDNSCVDCSVNDVIIKGVRGIKTFKLYYQTPPYEISGRPEKGGVGSVDDLFFEDIEINLDTPVDAMEEYLSSDKQKGSFAAFEIGANIGNIFLSDISLVLDREKYPMSFLVAVGPKSIRRNGMEIFDPYIRCEVGHLHLRDIKINGAETKELTDLIHEIVFNDIYSDKSAIGHGKIKHIISR